VAVDHVRQPALPAQKDQAAIDQLVKMVPKQLLADVALRAERQSHDAGFGTDLLKWNTVVIGHCRVIDQPRQQVDLAHTRMPSQCPRQFDDISHLTPGIRIATELHVVSANQSVHT
jgi:hypothetical protein